MYCDTDSAVFTTAPGQWEPPLGDYLGDLTDEVPDSKAPDNSITYFVTGGPKNYAFRLARPNKKRQTSICKVHGITLNALDINFDNVQKMDKSGTGVKALTPVDENKIVRNSETFKILTKKETKDYKIVFDKRIIMDDFETRPYGM